MKIINYLDRLDQDISLLINSLHCSYTDSFWQFVTARSSWYPLYLVIIIMLFIRLGWKKALLVILSIILTIAACDQFSNLIKHLVGRLRPCHNEYMINSGLHILEYKGNLFGFFSAHAANSFGLAICSYIGFKNDSGWNYSTYKYGMLIWAGFVSMSRIFVGKHYLGDVLVGTLVGIVFGLLIAYLFRFIIKRLL